jgi:hypothetical protein
MVTHNIHKRIRFRTSTESAFLVPVAYSAAGRIKGSSISLCLRSRFITVFGTVLCPELFPDFQRTNEPILQGAPERIRLRDGSSASWGMVAGYAKSLPIFL